jgi:hypothetical protein
MDFSLKNDFFITLESNSSMKYFPGNTIANFHVILPQRISLTNDFEVALVEAHMPNKWINVYDEYFEYSNIRMFEHLNEDKEIATAINPKKYLLTNGYYNKLYKLMEELNKYQKIFGYHNGTNLCSIELPKKSKIELSPKLTTILGFNESSFINVTDAAKTYYSSNQMNPDISMDSLYIYCNIIENQITSDIFSPLLRTIHIDEKFLEKNTLTKTFSYPLYIPLRHKQFHIIEINIRHTTGEFVKFLNNSHAILTLHFRKKT